MSNKAIKIVGILSLLLMFGNWDYYKPELYRSLIRHDHLFAEGGVKVEVKAYNKEECEKVFYRSFLDKGYYPLQITIHNDTDKSFSICPSSIDLKTIKPKELLKKYSKGSIHRKVAYSIVGFFFWPFAIPSAIDSVVTKKLMKKREKDMLAKSVKEEVILPYSSVTRVIFVPKEELKKEFAITLIDLDTLKQYPSQHQVEIG